MFLNKKFSDKIYDLFVNSSMWAYLSHYLWIMIIVHYFCRPLGISFAGHVIFSVIGCEICIVLSYLAIKKCKKIISKLR